MSWKPTNELRYCLGEEFDFDFNEWRTVKVLQQKWIRKVKPIGKKGETRTKKYEWRDIPVVNE